MDPRQILHPVAMGLTLAEEVLLCEVVVGSGDEVRSTSIMYLLGRGEDLDDAIVPALVAAVIDCNL